MPVGTGMPGGPPVAVSEREIRAERALRALPPPPSPPPGMGAVPAFAPPVPRANRTVLIVSLVLGATLLLCCGGGVFGVGGLFYYSYNTLQDDAVATVEGYLGDLQAGRYPQAYDRLCVEAKAQRSLDAFTGEQESAGQVTSYQVGSDIEVDQESNWLVTAQVVRQGGASGSETFPIVFNDANAAQICPR
ncbi:hypothetical protein [Cryptosporangium aurantiacum]|uniref:Uncharacterized protein n=1 Tax=Cryptosporangium aurantiacum TaxID=134849 RepID=A0A1M7Q5J9_9ACTN|nr:hypothetical protein [Cryptosporangium aurantiacum]SHN25486.1 hypothetical protein SAMN05443668_104168 [Cryptosporangium aurantiacum]